MDKIEYRAVIKYLCLKKLTPTDIHKDMQETLGDSAPSYAMVKKWCAEFKRGRTSVEMIHGLVGLARPPLPKKPT